MDKITILRTIREQPIKFGQFLGFDKLTELNNVWLVNMLQGKEDQTLLAHRGSYKTTVLVIFLVLHLITKPNENVIMFRKTDTDVTEVISAVIKCLESQFIRAVVRVLYGKELKILKQTNSEIHTNLSTYAKGTSQILGLGIGSSITGKHGDIIITDDIVNIKDRISKAERDRTLLSYMELQNIKNRGGRFINLGTPWHKNDAISKMPNVVKYDCYSTGLMTKEEIKQLRKSMTDSLFAANYELKHITDEKALFRQPKWEADHTLIYDGNSQLDARYQGEDKVAYTAMKRLSDGRIIGLGKLWDRHVNDCINDIEALQNRLRVGTLYNEINADKGYLADLLEDRGIFVETYNESTNKYVKIATYLKKYWDDIYWLEETDPEYMDQILDYTENAEHDDAPDSAASLLRALEDLVEVNLLSGGL